MSTTLQYTPTRRILWLRVLVREFLIPRPKWGRLLVGPELIGVGLLGIALATWWDSSALGLVSGALVGIGLGWASWPLAGAWLAVSRTGTVRQRKPVTLSVSAGVVELVRGDDRRVFPLEDLEQIETVGGENWLRFRGGRVLIGPRRAIPRPSSTSSAPTARRRPTAPSCAAASRTGGSRAGR
jgi:hypothetical protein